MPCKEERLEGILLWVVAGGVAILTVPAAKMTVSNRIWTATHTLPAQCARRAHMRPCIEIDKYFFYNRRKEKHLYYKFIRSHPKKMNGKMDKWSQSQYFDEVLRPALMPGSGNFESRSSEAESDGRTLRHQDINLLWPWSFDHLTISTCLPMHFSGMRPSKFKVNMLSFLPIIKKIFIYLYAWPHMSLGCRYVPCSNAVRHSHLAAGTVIATPVWDSPRGGVACASHSIRKGSYAHFHDW